MSTSNSSTVDLMVEVEQYLARTGRENTERNRLTVIGTNPKWRSRYPAWKEEQKKKKLHEARPRPMTSAQDQALVAEWLAAENKRRREYNDKLTTGVGLPPLEIGYANGQISFENAVHAAKLWFESRQAEYDDTVTAAGQARQQYLQAEHARANLLLHQPIDPNDPVYLKYKHLFTPLTDDNAAIYIGYKIDDIRTMIDVAKFNAQTNLVGIDVTPKEWDYVGRFIETNNFDPGCEENWENGFRLLVDLQILKRKDLGPITVDVKAPEMPVVENRPAESHLPQGRGAQEVQRLADALREIRANLGSYLTEIEQHDAVNPAEDIVIFNAYDSLLGKAITRDAVRKAFFYAALKIRGQRPSGFTDDEIEAWVDKTDAHKISAEEHRRQLALYGDVRLSRVPNEQTALLKELVGKLDRKGRR